MRTLSSLTAFLFLLIAAPAGAAVSTNQSGWLWGSPEPQGNTLPALEFQGTTGYAVGEFGTLLRTNDGGGTWGTVRTGLSLDFRALDMIDANSLVLASPCAARRTDDAGETFRRLPFTSSEGRCSRTLRDLSFPTADVGYLLLGEGGLLRTTDGGRSFSPRTVPGAGGQITALAFASANDGLATTTGGDIFRTTDGGDEWTRKFDGDPELNAVEFTGGRAVAVGNAGTFLVSTDGGDTWSPGRQPSDPAPLAKDFLDVRCASPALCLIVGRGGEVFRTADGGRTFTQTDAANALAVGFASATRAVTVGVSGETHLSNDGGANFSLVGSRVDATKVLSGVRALSTSVAHAWGEGGALERTTDGGETWDNVSVPTESGLSDVWFATSDLGYALDFGGGLFRTENAGGSWSILDTGTGSAPVAVFAPDASKVFLIGPRGVRRSSDGGATFERETDRVVRNRTLFEADEAGSAVVLWGPRVIAVSTNDGGKWRHVDRPTRAEIRHVDFVSSRVGYALEQSGRVYFTKNRGRSWAELIGVGYSNGQRLAFGDRRHGWLDLGSAHPTVLRTTDGGNSWTPQILGPSSAVTIAAAGSQTGFATLRNPSSILFTHDGGGAGGGSTLKLSTPDQAVPRGTKIKLKGRLSPAEGGEDVEVRVRKLNGRGWREIDVTPNGAGKFSFKRRIRSTSVFVAQWEGDADSDGDGSKPLIVRVGG